VEVACGVSKLAIGRGVVCATGGSRGEEGKSQNLCIESSGMSDLADLVKGPRLSRYLSCRSRRRRLRA